ncbi:MAG: hypothetical protein K2R93_14360 [Gemmatimonadaceae bacterium]|nr:hypothetical protein [Gemmatimonadaceae bacterium]
MAVKHFLATLAILGPALTSGFTRWEPGEAAIVRTIASGSPCLDTTDELADINYKLLSGFLLSADSTHVVLKSQMNLPLTSGVPVVVSDTLICRKYRRAIDSLSGKLGSAGVAQPDTTRAIAVFSVDSLFVAVDVYSVEQARASVWQLFRSSGVRIGQIR